MRWNKPTSNTPLVGNDVVDLSEPATHGKAGQLRFLKRVCVDQEREFIEDAPQPDAALWLLWSAKETAYKIAKRLQPEIAFVKKHFVVAVHTTSYESGHVRGQVVYEGAIIPVRWRHKEAFVHCVGHWPGVIQGFSKVGAAVARLDDPTLDEIPLDHQELQSVRNLPSRRVRQLAKRLLAERGLTQARIVRERIDDQWKAPRIWHQGRPLKDAALSLSHHGQYVAVVLWLAV